VVYEILIARVLIGETYKRYGLAFPSFVCFLRLIPKIRRKKLRYLLQLTFHGLLARLSKMQPSPVGRLGGNEFEKQLPKRSVHTDDSSDRLVPCSRYQDMYD
jgi:hypothetical protein